MPWTAASAPKHVKGDKKRRQWAKVANSMLAKNNDEGRAIAAANSVVKKTKEFSVGVGEKGYVSGWEAEVRQFPQDAAAYNPLGATANKGCANCNWFVPESDGCVLVGGDISPTGISRFWEPKHVYKMEPMPVLIVNENWKEKEVGPVVAKKNAAFAEGRVGEGVLERVFSWAKRAVGIGSGEEARAFVLFEDANGDLRFATSFTNNFEDKHTEILCDEAHKEYVGWVNESKIYPELQVWHCGSKSKYGMVDFVDYVDGFVVASGVIDEGKEEFAWKVYESNPGVSHGFVGVKPNGKHWLAYRTFEISTLPREYASNANLDCLFAPGSKEFFDMPFSVERKTHLKSLGLTDEAIADWEGGIKATKDGLEKAGIQFKSSVEDAPEVPAGEATPAGTATTTGTEPATGGAVEYVTKSELAFALQGIGDITKGMGGLATSLTALATSVKSVQDTVATIQKPVADQVADAWQAAVAQNPGGHVATATKENVAPDAQALKEQEWFGQIAQSWDKAAGLVGG